MLLLFPFLTAGTLNCQEELNRYGVEGRVMLRPTSKVIFDFRPHEEGFLVVIVNFSDKDFTFKPEEITIRQNRTIWKPLYMTVAPDAVSFPLQFSELHMPAKIKKFSRVESITIGGGDWQTFGDLQDDLKDNAPEGLWPFCYLALEEPLPDYTRPLEIRFNRDRRSVNFGDP